jgi:Skp family chaperone for outer membrane proteins
MARWNILAAAAVCVAAAALVTRAAGPQAAADAAKPDEAKAAAGQKIGFFNVLRVLKQCKRSAAMTGQLNGLRFSMSLKLVEWKGQLAKLEEGSEPKDEEARDARAKEVMQLTRKIEDREREINKALAERTTEFIGELHDDLRAVSADAARANGLSALLAYPDVVNPEEMQFPQVKELKLKPPAATPFYLDPKVDYTDELIKRLNDKFAAGGGR